MMREISLNLEIQIKKIDGPATTCHKCHHVVEVSGFENHLCILCQWSFWLVWLYANLVLVKINPQKKRKFIKSEMEHNAVWKNIILYCYFVFRSVIKKLCCFFLFLAIYPKTLRQINQGIYFVDDRPTVFLSSKLPVLRNWVYLTSISLHWFFVRKKQHQEVFKVKDNKSVSF